ncbi:MAG: DNA-processing protein DprA [Chloroherpetonaceae bacterium]|nr:DNA-processing protein DprA [Chloroherpetonaceae bacterium]MCS7210591.1 DNA-processing protein DprA [Chloroherpetonaceae bacterium]
MSSDADFLITLLALSKAPSIGAVRLRALVSAFGTPQRICAASRMELQRISGIGARLADILYAYLHGPAFAQAKAAAEAQLERCQKLGAAILTFWDADYPTILKETYDAPPYLFVRGNLTPDALRVAVVGTRHPTEYGRNATRKFVSALAATRAEIVSGLAFGIDMVAHQTALESGLRTVAVLGSGVDTIYTDPRGKLYPRIIEQGAILSEEWMGTAPVAENFPKRNRIISGLSHGVIIVESDIKGGAMITAKYALEQNREVFAVPGSIFSRKSNGTNALIRDSHAKLVLSAEDVLSELVPSHPTTVPAATATLPLDLSPEEAQVYALLSNTPMHIDDLCEASGLDVSDLLVVLFELEVKQCVKQLPGKFFQRA